MSKPVILCVDDERMLLESLREELRGTFGRDYLIELADSGYGGLELVDDLMSEGTDIALVISDYIMPDLRGDELLRQIHQRLPDTRKVMLTGQATIEAVAHAVKHARLYRYIAKPWEPEDLRLTVTEALHSYRQEQELNEQHQRVMQLNRALEEFNHTLEQRVAERTQELIQALTDLKTAQESVIRAEKMAALGQLVAGVAHEINTPMGAIRASIGSLNTAMERSLHQLPPLLRTLPDERLADFYTLLSRVEQNPTMLTSREERLARKQLSTELNTVGITDAETLAMRLVNIGITGDIAEIIPMLQTPQGEAILAAIHDLITQRNSGTRIQLAVEKASKIIGALKRYAHEDKGEQKTVIDLADSIDLVLTIYHNSLKYGIEVIKQYEPVAPVWCYPDELHQVWTNLIHNAIQAMQGQGTLSIRVRQEGDRAIVEFTDSGCGIPPEIQGKIFDPFFTTKPVGEGSGMGLSIVHRLVEHHQGSITLKSAPGHTLFRVCLPLEEPGKTAS